MGELEKDHTKLAEELTKLEARVRALEIAWAKIMGMSAGGAIVGGALFQLFQYLAQK